MVQVGLPVERHVEVALRLQPRVQTLVVIPVRRIDCNGAVAVAVLRTEGMETVAELTRLALVERWKAKPLPEAGLVAQHIFVAQEVCLEFVR
jgi:hypothetical protein